MIRSDHEVLVVGGTGFVGRHLSLALVNAGYAVTCTGRRSFESVSGLLAPDACYRESIASVDGCFDLVIHLACDIGVRGALEAPERFIRANIEPTLAVGGLLRRISGPRRVLYLSSDRVYGASSGVLTESSATAPVEPYGVVKLVGEHILAMYARTNGLDMVTLRAANLYGPSQRPVQLLPSLITKILSGQRVVRLGNLSASRNFLFIDDLIEAMMAVIQRKEWEAGCDVFNVGDEVHRIADVVTLLGAVVRSRLGIDVEFVAEADQMRPKVTQLAPAELSSEKLEEVVGWKASVPLRSGLEKTVESWEDTDGSNA